MEKIRELIRTLEGKKIQGIPALRQINPNANQRIRDKSLKFIRLLRKDKNMEEEALVKALFGKKPNARALFVRQKRRLKAKLQHLFLHIDIEQFTQRKLNKITVDCLRDALKVRTLQISKSKFEAESLGKKALKKALKYEQYQSAIILCSALRSLAPGFREAKYYSQQQMLCLQMLKAESEVEGLYDEMVALSRKSTVANIEILELSERAVARANLALEEFTAPSGKLKLYRFRLLAMHDELKGAFTQLLGLCKQWEVFNLAEKKKETPYGEQAFEIGMHQMSAYIGILQPEKALEVCPSLENLYAKGGINWYQFKELQLVAFMHLHRLEEAVLLIKEAMGLDGFKNAIPKNVQDRWRFYYLFMYVVFPEKLKLNKKQTKEIRITEIFKSAYFKDKKGLNFWFVIIQIYYFLRQGDLELARSKLRSAELYADRYLQTNADERNRTLIELLSIFMNENVAHRNAKKEIKLLLQKLKKAERTNMPGIEGIELLPMEKMWELFSRVV